MSKLKKNGYEVDRENKTVKCGTLRLTIMGADEDGSEVWAVERLLDNGRERPSYVVDQATAKTIFRLWVT